MRGPKKDGKAYADLVLVAEQVVQVADEVVLHHHPSELPNSC